MSRRGRRILWAMILLGVVVRVVLAFTTFGDHFDIGSEQMVARQLRSGHPLSLYTTVNAGLLRWPYPSGYFPWLLFSQEIEFHTPLPFESVVQLLPIAADAALAWVVQAYLGDRGAGERARLGAAALIALGPSLALVSGWGGQLDSVAILPAALALLLWERLPRDRRALAAGLLIGLGAAVKSVPIVLLLALLPTVSNRREALVLVSAAVVVPLVTIAPWLAAEPHATLRALRYNGLPGYGGLTLLVQPDLALALLVKGHAVGLNGAQSVLHDARTLITGGALVAVFVYLLRRRPEPAKGAVIVWLVVYVFGLNFGPRYVLWALPFMLMAGYLWEALLLQAVAFPAGLIVATTPHEATWLGTVYAAMMLGLLAAFAAWLAFLATRTPPALPPGTT
ncbi:MAG: glycosyltransferase 87 family protein [Thermoleophilaceae bacterium]|jgi:Glycosyltransferase family 87